MEGIYDISYNSNRLLTDVASIVIGVTLATEHGMTKLCFTTSDHKRHLRINFTFQILYSFRNLFYQLFDVELATT